MGLLVVVELSMIGVAAWLHGAMRGSYAGVVLAESIAAGLRTPKGGKPTTKPLLSSVDIPGIYDFLHISEASLTLVNNAQYEPEQVLLLETNTGVTEAEMKKAISAYVLPVRPLKEATPQKEQYSWGTYEISNEVLKASTPLKLEQIPNEREFATTHSFRFQADVGRMVYVKVAKGLRSFGGYILFQQADYALRVPEYPKELKIMQNGALLSLSGEKKVSLYARDVEAVRVELSRLLPGQLHHLVDQNNGSFQTPEFYNYRFNFDNISEVFSDVISLPSVAHGKAQYAAVDLGKYLEGRGEDRRGIFYLKVESWDKDRRINTGKTEYRLVMLTDLGLLVKDNSDGTHDVFVQSLSTGEPVKGAHVEVIGKNGLAIASDSTGADGHVTLPQEPAVLLFVTCTASSTRSPDTVPVGFGMLMVVSDGVVVASELASTLTTSASPPASRAPTARGGLSPATGRATCSTRR